VGGLLGGRAGLGCRKVLIVMKKREKSRKMMIQLKTFRGGILDERKKETEEAGRV